MVEVIYELVKSIALTQMGPSYYLQFLPYVTNDLSAPENYYYNDHFSLNLCHFFFCDFFYFHGLIIYFDDWLSVLRSAVLDDV